MKSFLSFCILLLISSAMLRAQFNNPQQTVYEKLANVNKEWLKKNYDDLILNEHTVFQSDEVLIQLHLKLVEEKLRNANLGDLNEQQKHNRLQCLDYLDDYWKTGRFPKNTHHPVRTPYFIDDFGTLCAVGYLIVESGHKDLALKIHDESNYAYVREMKYPELLAWADEYGFSVDELAWIQPGYAPPQPSTEWTSMQIGIENSVNTITVDENNDIMYVAADFDDSLFIKAYDGATWNDLDGGVNGPVKVILTSNDIVWVGGSFNQAGNNSANNVSVYIEGQWYPVGSGVPGTVNALVLYAGDLYAGGHFVYQNKPYGLAMWDGTNWTPMTDGPDNTVNALEVYHNQLYAGGDFDFVGNQTIKNIVRYDGSDFYDMGVEGYPTIVRALKEFRDSLIIAGDFSYNDTTGEISGFALWDQARIIPSLWNVEENTFITHLEVFDDTLFASGLFHYYPSDGFYGSNVVAISQFYTIGPNTAPLGDFLAWGVDSTINAAVKFNGAYVLGGSFSEVNGNTVNKIVTGKWIINGVDDNNIQPKVSVVNDPNSAIISMDQPNNHPLTLDLIDMQGKLIYSYKSNNHRWVINYADYPAGIYLYHINDSKSPIASGKVVLSH